MIALELFKVNLPKLTKNKKRSVEARERGLSVGYYGLIAPLGFGFVQSAVCALKELLLILIRQQGCDACAHRKADFRAARGFN
jgi:pantoate kinase